MAEPPSELKQDPKHCTRCDGPMKSGFLMDGNHAGNVPMPGYWASQGRKKMRFVGWIPSVKERHEIVAYRCTLCYHLDLFAPLQPAP